MTNFENPYRKRIDDISYPLYKRYHHLEQYPIEYRIEINTLIIQSHIFDINNSLVDAEDFIHYKYAANLVFARLIRDVSTTILNKHCK